jgi:23S rRNA (cytosine1962-C5)-methyltransferase
MGEPLQFPDTQFQYSPYPIKMDSVFQHSIPLIISSGWADYALLDSGNFEKLERFGNYVFRRPEPQAIWQPSLSASQWDEHTQVTYQGTSANSGKWLKRGNIPDNWEISYQLPENSRKLHFGLALTGFKHVGIFPEQSHNWDEIYLRMRDLQNPKFLNLFAYTGGASLAAAAAGAEVYHVDSIRQVVSWAKRNMEASGLYDIRWVVEDALKFAKREQKRGKVYQGIILDPPAFGHGPSGESWKLEKNLADLLRMVIDLLDPQHPYLVLNTYSLGLSSVVIGNVLADACAARPELSANISVAELCLEGGRQRLLPLGVLAKLLPK